MILLALCLTPFLVYYSSGFLTFIMFFLFLLFEIILGVILIRRTYDFKNGKIISPLIYFVLPVIAICIGSLFLESYIYKLDWELRINERNNIVQSIKNGSIKLDGKHTTVRLSNFPPISNGGNEIIVTNESDNSLTVEFFIDRGFLDHYSSYIYTDNESKIEELNKRIELNLKYYHANERLSENWYRVSY